jgi:predicted ABC-type ATPase
MTASKQVWILAGGNGAGKSTFYNLFLASKGIQYINSDRIARDINPGSPEEFSYEAAAWAGRLRDDMLYQGKSFCFETVFSHKSKIDFVARARSLNYKIILVYIHLSTPELNEARVRQRVNEGGHNVPREKIYSRIPRTIKNIAKVLSLVDEARLLDNSTRENPYRQVAIIKKGKRVKVTDQLPGWAEAMLKDIP